MKHAIIEATIYGIPDEDGNYTGPASEEDAKAYAQEMADFYADAKYNVDWEDAFFRKHGSSQSYEFSAQGGDERNSFFHIGARESPRSCNPVSLIPKLQLSTLIHHITLFLTYQFIFAHY